MNNRVTVFASLGWLGTIANFASDAKSVFGALAALASRLHDWGWPLIDAQVENDHLHSLGGCLMPRAAFLERVAELVDQPAPADGWAERFGLLPASALSQPSVP